MSVSPNNQKALWLVFIALGFFWGSSYLFIKIGVDNGLTPFTLVTLRLLVGSILLGAVVFVAKEQLPRDPRMYVKIAILAFFAIALPFVLITIAEQHVPSALAATLTAPVPLFTIPFAAILLHDRITPAKIAGVVVGLIGVAVLMGFDPAQIGQADLTFQLVLVAAAVSYGFGGVFARKYVSGMRPMVPAFIEVTCAMIMALIGSLLFENPIGEIGSLPRAGALLSAVAGRVRVGPRVSRVLPPDRCLGSHADVTCRLPAAHLGHRPGLHRAQRAHPVGPDPGHGIGHRGHRLRQPGSPFGHLRRFPTAREDRPTARRDRALDTNSVSRHTDFPVLAFAP